MFDQNRMKTGKKDVHEGIRGELAVSVKWVASRAGGHELALAARHETVFRTLLS